MPRDRRNQAVAAALSKRIRLLTRLEKAFYGAIIVTAITMAVSLVYLQSRNQEVKQQITDLTSQINEAETELNNAKQEVNELSRADRVKQIAGEAGLSIQNDNIQKVDDQ
ncbi:cell division protein FtsL [Streptococcus loxodontisalivarius]|uniref:Cell division protein FtsL n=1 Tax=Streptococcus loxodontisalivarius TaxID=1349415 RepID=A0ABS2PSA6_9STRE|nr:cell division protein FtsL [Streptococcus loxodontisalivarius]MBM7642394.1 cell division protein FtsL [Streptococcus loxodontisalivarius]